MRGSTGQLDKEANRMAYITKQGNSYSVRYTYEDEHGKSCDKWESFPTKEEATNRNGQIEHELAAGTLQFQPMHRIPTKTPTVQKPCIDRAGPDFSGLHNEKERQILRFDAQYLVHLAHSYPNFSPFSRLPRKRPFLCLPYS